MKPFDVTAVPLAGVNLIEASAGTGKTYAIATLFLRLLISGLRPEQILVVTFTEAATKELRDRIRSRLSDAAAHAAAWAEGRRPIGHELEQLVVDPVTPRDAHQRLSDALARFDQAEISTIHGFCQRTLHHSAFESGSRFDTELVTDNRPLIDEAILDFWANNVSDASPELIAGLRAANVSPSSLRNLVRKALANPQLRLLPSSGERPTPDGTAFAAAHHAAKQAWDLAEVQRLLLSANLNGNLYRRSSVPKWCEGVSEFFEQQLVAPTLPPRFEKFAWESIRNAAKSTPSRHPFFLAAERLLDAHRAYRQRLDLYVAWMKRALIESVRSALQERKRLRGILSFDDLLLDLKTALERDTGGLLTGALRRQYPAALIDEFQDTDPIQYEIFRRIYSGPNLSLFLIGDPKQAIYSFRGADVFAYINAAEHVSADRRYTMTTNYRSDAGLIRAVNRLFSRLSHPFLLSAISFYEVGAADHGTRIELDESLGHAPLELCVVPAGDSGKPAKGKRRPSQQAGKLESRRLPELVAADISRLLRSRTRLQGRALNAGDVCVLTRTNAQAFQLQAALRELGVPSVVIGDKSVYESEEAQELQRLLAAIVEPGNSRAVRAAMTTELLGVTANELALMDEAPDGHPHVSEFELWIDRFRQWHQTWSTHGFIKMFRQLTTQTRLEARLLPLVDGERRLTNLNQLTELLHTAGSTLHLGPPGLLHYLALQRGGESRYEETEQIRLESDERAVTLTTVHKSKGLEYPIVYCPYLWNGMLEHSQDKGAPIFHDEGAGGALTLDLGCEQLPDHSERAKWEKLAESLRLAYVALTRARHRTVIYWTTLHGYKESALGYLLFPPQTLNDEVPSLDAISGHLGRLEPSAALAQLRTTLAAEGLIEVRSLDPADAGSHVPAPTPAGASLRSRKLTRSVDLLWRTGSFSQLAAGSPERTHTGLDATEGRDHDLLDVTRSLTAGEQAVGPLVQFPRGTQAGNFFHALLEHWDFQESDTGRTRDLVLEHLRSYGYDADVYLEGVTRALYEIVQTPLDRGKHAFCLRDIPPMRRVNELEFHLPVGGLGTNSPLTPHGIAHCFERHPSPEIPTSYPKHLAQLGSPPLAGFLKGYIDVVFVHDGRYYLADYKTNYLGDRLDDYAARRLPEPMARSHYFLQYHLYALALHRYLEKRIGDYDYTRHFGGVFYLFLRGMTPQSGPTSGVFFERPPMARIRSLSRLFASGEGSNKQSEVAL